MKAPPKSPNSKVEVMHVITLEEPADTSTASRYATGTSARSEQSKLLGLELLRFVSAFAVLVFHYQHFVFRGVSQPATFVRSNQPLYSILSLFYVHGFEGVRVFWCISGFIFFWRYRDLIGDGQIGGRKFLILRFSRLYPLHFVTLLLVAILQVVYLRINGSFFVYSANDFPHFVLQLFMASNWGISEGDSFNGPIWSISLEVLVYALFYVLLAFVSKSCLINIGVLLMCGLARILGLHHLIFDCLAFFYSGGLSAIAYRSMKSPRLRALSTRLVLGILVAVILAIWMFSLYARPRFSYFFFLGCTPLALFCLCSDFKLRPLARSWVEAAGNMTYSSYLLHFPLQLALVISYNSLGATIPFYSTGFFCLFMGGTLLAAHFVYEYFELPAQRSLRLRLR